MEPGKAVIAGAACVAWAAWTAGTACAPASQGRQSPVPEGASVIVRLVPAHQILTLRCDEGTVTHHGVERVSGRVRSMGPDTLTVTVTSFGTAGGIEEPVGRGCVASLRRDSTVNVTVINPHPRATEHLLGLGAVALILALLVVGASSVGN